MTLLEDIYLPYKRKKKTRASVAKEKGLEPLAILIFMQNDTDNPFKIAAEYLNENVATQEDALQGARDIIAEWMSEDEQIRTKIRYYFEKEGLITSKVVRNKDEEGFLRVSIVPREPEYMMAQLEKSVIKGNGDASNQVKLALEDSYDRLLSSSIETEFRNASKERADVEAIKVFAENARQLLLAAPLGQKRILAIDPGFRSGCKIVCLDETGTLLYNTNIYPHPPQNQEREALTKLDELIDKYKLEAIAVGNGTAGRESVTMLKGLRNFKNVVIFSVNEAGASIYSASEAAREEFPDHDVTVRGSVSIGRRLADPLAELVKIDPKSIGVGQYQHDVNQSLLKQSLDRTVESAVNSVGINVNTASKHLLAYVSGLGPVLAQNIVTYRTENGLFKSRSEIKKVARMGEKAFEQCAGFLRVRDAKNPLDNTAVHPEAYSTVEAIAKDMSCKVSDLIENSAKRKEIDLKKYVSDKIGLPTLQDIILELAKPGLDPRGEAKAFEFGNVHSLEDLFEGMILPGIVTNITNFGAFVDIGVKQDGLVHISQLANKFVKNPNDIVKLNDHVTVKITEVDVARKRVFLTMKGV